MCEDFSACSAPSFQYARSATEITTPNSRHFVIEGDMKGWAGWLTFGFTSSDGKKFNVGWYMDELCIQGDGVNQCTSGEGLRSFEDWMHVRIEVNNNVITGYAETTGYAGTVSVTATTNSVFMPGYVTAELWDATDSITGWFDNITVYGY